MGLEVSESNEENPFKVVEELKKKAPHLWSPVQGAPRARYDRRAENRAISRATAGLPRDGELIG
jgi:hypothetical protein